MLVWSCCSQEFAQAAGWRDTHTPYMLPWVYSWATQVRFCKCVALDPKALEQAYSKLPQHVLEHVESS